MSEEMPKCSKERQCISCKENGGCRDFEDLKLMVGNELISKVKLCE